MRLLIVACAVLVVSAALFFYQEHRSSQRIEKLSDTELSSAESVNDSAAIAVTNRWLTDAGAEPLPESFDLSDEFGNEQLNGAPEEELCCPEENTLPPVLADDSGSPHRNEENAQPVKRKRPPLRERLIAKHGDIPLVHRYLAAREKFFRKEIMTFEEHMDWLEGLAKFTSSQRNKDAWERFKRDHAGADPDSFRMKYDHWRSSK